MSFENRDGSRRLSEGDTASVCGTAKRNDPMAELKVRQFECSLDFR